MGKAIKKLFQRGIDRRNRTTRPGAPDDLSSMGATGLAAGVEGSNRVTPNRRPGRRHADTPLGPKGGRRM